MKLFLQIDCDNEAFAGDNCYLEISRLLLEAAERAAEMRHEWKLRDANGNSVGYYAIRGEG